MGTAEAATKRAAQVARNTGEEKRDEFVGGNPKEREAEVSTYAS